MWIISIICAAVTAVVLCVVYTIMYNALFGGMDGYFNLSKLEMSSMFHGKSLMPTNNFSSLSVNSVFNTKVFAGMIVLSHFVSWGIWLASIVMLVLTLLAWVTYNGRKNTADVMCRSGANVAFIKKLVGVYRIAPIYITILYLVLFITAFVD